MNKFNQEITMIAAVSEDNGLGLDNKLVWHIPRDLKHFKDLTHGHCIIMGRRTFESLPKALPNRKNIVLSRRKNITYNDAIVVNCIEKALDAVISCEPIDKKIKQAEKKGRFVNNPNANVRDIAEEAFKIGIIADEELALVKKRDELRNVVIHVDEFDNSLSKIKKPNQKSTRKNA